MESPRRIGEDVIPRASVEEVAPGGYTPPLRVVSRQTGQTFSSSDSRRFRLPLGRCIVGRHAAVEKIISASYQFDRKLIQHPSCVDYVSMFMCTELESQPALYIYTLESS